MKQMRWKKRCIATLLMIILTLTFNTNVYAQTVLPSGNSTDEIGSKIESFVSEHEKTTAGMAVTVFDATNIIYLNQFGHVDIEHQITVDEDTVFEWGSISKLFVWVSVMQLYEQGKIDLNADVRDYLPEGFLTNLNYETPVTMTNLMNHNAGFQELITDLFYKDCSEVPSLEDALQLHQPEQIYEPGTVVAYSNWGCALAAYIVERISGQSFDQYVHEHIFDVLEMKHTAILPDLSDNTYVKEKRAEYQCYTTNCELITPNIYYISLYPAGMCTGTIQDLTKFAQALLQEDCVLFSDNHTRNEMFTPSDYFGDTGIARNSHGFWTIVFDARPIGHGGNTVGSSAYLLMDLESGIGSVVMTNQANEMIYNTEMMKLIYGSYQNSELAKSAEIPTGIYRSARVVQKGPLSFTRVGFSDYDSSDLNEFFVYTVEDGVGKVSKAYGDELKLTLGSLFPEIILLVAFAECLIFSLSYILSWPIGVIRRKQTKQKKEITSQIKNRRIAAVLQLIVAVMVASLAGCVMSYENSATYAGMPIVCTIVCFIMIYMFVPLIRGIKKDHSRKEIILSIITMISLLVCISNVLYWQLFMFWKI